MNNLNKQYSRIKIKEYNNIDTKMDYLKLLADFEHWWNTFKKSTEYESLQEEKELIIISAEKNINFITPIEEIVFLCDFCIQNFNKISDLELLVILDKLATISACYKKQYEDIYNHTELLNDASSLPPTKIKQETLNLISEIKQYATQHKEDDCFKTINDLLFISMYL